MPRPKSFPLRTPEAARMSLTGMWANAPEREILLRAARLSASLHHEHEALVAERDRAVVLAKLTERVNRPEAPQALRVVPSPGAIPRALADIKPLRLRSRLRFAIRREVMDSTMHDGELCLRLIAFAEDLTRRLHAAGYSKQVFVGAFVIGVCEIVGLREAATASELMRVAVAAEMDNTTDDHARVQNTWEARLKNEIAPVLGELLAAHAALAWAAAAYPVSKRDWPPRPSPA